MSAAASLPAPVAVSATERPDLVPAMRAINSHAWPEFMHHNPLGNRYWDGLYQTFPDNQLALIDQTGQVLGVGNSLPLHVPMALDALPENGWEWAIERGFTAPDAPTHLCGLAIALPAAHRGAGYSRHAVRAMRDRAAAAGFPALIIPIRPNHKARYPLTPIERYLTWQRADGLPVDPWLRVHVRQGARILHACPRSMTIEGTVADWEAWSGLVFPESGPYIVPDALAPVQMDVDGDLGRYVEPNVWIVHGLGT